MNSVAQQRASSPQPKRTITPAELPIWVPGKIMSDSGTLGWKDVAQRTYRYKGQDVEVPPMDSYMIVQYRQGETPMDRKFAGRWTRTKCRPGEFSLLSRSEESHWHWTETVEVSHLYLTDALMARVASDLMDEDVAEVHLDDVLRRSDPVVSHVADELTREARDHNVGGPIYAEALAVQLAVHLVRRYASCVTRQPADPHRLSHRELRRLHDFIDAHLHDQITLEDMARLLGLGVWTLNRRLKQTLGCSGHALVIEKRIERALGLLRRGDLALKEIAAACGFSDQAHLTRTFRAKLGTTPGQVRKDL